MNNLVRKNVRSYIHTHMQEVIDLICTISSISSPTGHEETKAAWILSQLHKMGATEAYIDDAGNVLYPYQIPPTGKFPLYNAHIDTVFSQLDTIVPHIDGDCLYAPSCGDNSADVAALLCIARMLLTLHIPLPAGVMLAFNVGEEGLGNLKGIRHIMNTWHDRISEVVAVDGTADAFVNRAVGSHRYAVHIQAQGGHSWADFGNTNALAIAAEIIHDLYQMQLPAVPKTTYNIGTLTGGTTVNSIAAQADLTLDLRSESMSSLLKLDANIAAIIQRHTTTDCTNHTNLDRRPPLQRHRVKSLAVRPHRCYPPCPRPCHHLARRQHRCQHPPKYGHPSHSLQHIPRPRSPYAKRTTFSFFLGTGTPAINSFAAE